jgi:hypothetical protein
MNTQFVYQGTNSEAYYLAYRDYQNESDDGFFVHKYFGSFDKVQGQYLNVFEYFFDKAIPFEVRISSAPTYTSTRFGNELIAIASHVYTGTIGVLNLQDLTENQIGNHIDDFYTIYDWDNRDRYRATGETGFSSIGGRRGNYFYKRHGTNFGLVGNDKFLLHFYGIFQEKDIIPYMSIYDVSGTLLQTVSLQNSPVSFIRDNIISVTPHALDNDNNLYVSDYLYQNSHPAVRVFKTNLHELID